MFDIILYQPEIPPNTGNILRLTANAGCRLHLVKPLGFRMSDRALKRAGLGYADIREVEVHDDWGTCLNFFRGRRVFAVSTRAERSYADCHFTASDVFLFGPETRGLPDDLLESFPIQQRIRLPMVNGSRSLNLSNAVAIVIYEAWRQTGFATAR